MSNRAIDARIERVAQSTARFEATGDLLIVLGEFEDDDARLVLYLSPEWERVFGQPVASLVGEPFAAILEDAPVQVVFRDSGEERANPQADPLRDHSILLQYSDARTGSRILEGQGFYVLEDPADCLMIFRDATESWNAVARWIANTDPDREQRNVNSQRLVGLGALAGKFAHAFNNFLTPIVGNANLALLDLPAKSPVRKPIEKIRAAADRATALTAQMLTFAGQGASNVNAVNVSVAVEEMTLLLESMSSGGTKIDYTLKGDLPFIEVDDRHIGQIVLNLVANACESFPESGGRIEIRSGLIEADQAYLDACQLSDNVEKGQYVYLEVCDNGSGIPREDLGRIFEPYFTTRASGRGLGLTAIDGIVHRYRGALDLMSQVGEGTRVRVLFPTNR